MGFRRRRRLGWFFTLVAIIAAIVGYLASTGRLAWLFGGNQAPLPVEGEAEFHFIDVGQGDAALIRTVQGHVLIDAGTNDSEDALIAYLKAEGIKELAYAVFTHPHEDHIGNARMLIESDTVGALILPPMHSDDMVYRMVLDAAAARNVPCHIADAGARFAVGDATLEILFADAEAKEINDGSIICRLLYGKTAALFTGDAEGAAEQALLSAVPAEKLDCDLLKAGHHGSDTSLCEELLLAASPTHVAISCGKENDYGFPHAALLGRLQAVGAVWHRTDEEGTLCYVSDGESLVYKGE